MKTTLISALLISTALIASPVFANDNNPGQNNPGLTSYSIGPSTGSSTLTRAQVRDAVIASQQAGTAGKPLTSYDAFRTYPATTIKSAS